MSSLKDEVTIKHRRDTASNWTSNNPTPNEGEKCYETDTGKEKIGDGSTAWASLAYLPLLSEVDAKLTGVTDQLCKAWVVFDGTTNVGGFCTILDSYNVTSVADGGTGIYTITITTALTDTNYCISGTSILNITVGEATSTPVRTTTALKINTTVSNSAASYDPSFVSVMFYGS